MTTIETFCRVCAEPIGVQVEEVTDELRRLLARLGVTCERCARPRWQHSGLRVGKVTRPVSAPHNDP